MKRFILIVLLISALITGCASEQSAATDSPADSGTTEDGRTMPAGIPTPMEGNGVIYGKLLNLFDDQPVEGTPFLSKNLSYEDQDMPATISFSLMNDPRAIFNAETGDFYFQDIEPAENYVIVLSYGPGDIYIIRNTENEYPLVVSIEANQTLDLGTILAEEP